MFKLFLIPVIICVVVQLIKVCLDLAKGRFSWTYATGYGGMPSSHAALVTSLATMMFITEGINSAAFAISLILAGVVIRDAFGLRGYLSQHSRVLNRLIKELPDEEEYKFPFLEERIAHTIAQLAIGGLLGIIFTLILLPIWPFFDLLLGNARICCGLY